MTSQSVKNIIRLDTDASWICSCLETWQRWDLVSFRHQKRRIFLVPHQHIHRSQWKPHSSTGNSFRENDILQRQAGSTTLNWLGWTYQAASTGLIKTNYAISLHKTSKACIKWPKLSTMAKYHDYKQMNTRYTIPLHGAQMLLGGPVQQRTLGRHMTISPLSQWLLKRRYHVSHATTMASEIWHIKGDSLMQRLVFPQHSLELPRLGFE